MHAAIHLSICLSVYPSKHLYISKHRCVCIAQSGRCVQGGRRSRLPEGGEVPVEIHKTFVYLESFVHDSIVLPFPTPGLTLNPQVGPRLSPKSDTVCNSVARQLGDIRPAPRPPVCTGLGLTRGLSLHSGHRVSLHIHIKARTTAHGYECSK